MALFADPTRCVEDTPSAWAPGCTCDANFSYRLQKKKKEKDIIGNGLTFCELDTECSYYYCTNRRYERDIAVCFQTRYSRACCIQSQGFSMNIPLIQHLPMAEISVPDSSINPLPPAWACLHIDFMLSLLPYREHGRTPMRALYGSRRARHQPHRPNRSSSYYGSRTYIIRAKRVSNCYMREKKN